MSIEGFSTKTEQNESKKDSHFQKNNLLKKELKQLKNLSASDKRMTRRFCLSVCMALW